VIEHARPFLRQVDPTSSSVPDVASDADQESIAEEKPRPSCLVCELTILSGEVVVFEEGDLVHVDCHWDRPTSRRPLSRAMRWPR
jgi:hypothetical protein